MKTQEQGVRVRFAPSPTGFLHVGGARTALFNWLFARHCGGRFFLRIEDTDRSRSTEEAVVAIVDGLGWLGIDWDRWGESDLMRQTERMERYRSEVQNLLDRGEAYRCYCTPDELESRRKEAMAAGQTYRYDGRCRSRSLPAGSASVVRFAAPPTGEIVVEDLVKGKVVFDAASVDDFILLRSDATPTYNFCVVIDDVDMEITDIIRGDDHLNNTPKQIQLYRALGKPIPRFAHLSMILGADRTRLSKRHGATAVQQYREEGYLPEAMVNYLVRLGWSFQDQEVFTREELIEKFSMVHVGTSAAIFNPEKLLWLNAHYIKTGSPGRLTDLLTPHLVRRGIASLPSTTPPMEPIVVALQERSRTLEEMAESAAYFLSDDFATDETAQQQLTAEALPILRAVHVALSDLAFESQTLSARLKQLAGSMGLKLAQVAQPVRAAVTGKTVSPGIFEVLALLGREKTLGRLDRAMQVISTEAGAPRKGRAPSLDESQ
jgi:glutamyl-tRNA synthetase